MRSYILSIVIGESQGGVLGNYCAALPSLSGAAKSTKSNSGQHVVAYKRRGLRGRRASKSAREAKAGTHL